MPTGKNWIYSFKPIFKVIDPVVLEKIFEGYNQIWAWRQSLSNDQSFTDKLSFPHRNELHMKFGLNWSSGFIKEVIWKWWRAADEKTDDEGLYDHIYLSLWLRWSKTTNTCINKHIWWLQRRKLYGTPWYNCMGTKQPLYNWISVNVTISPLAVCVTVDDHEYIICTKPTHKYIGELYAEVGYAESTDMNCIYTEQ